LFIVAAIIIIFVNGNQSAASASLTIKSNNQSGSRLDQIPDSPAAEIPLVLGDGPVENAIGVGGTSSFIFFNRFSPDPPRFPFELTSYQGNFHGAMGASVDELNLFLYLPIIFKPLPSPVLSPINNPSGEANYSVIWNSVDLAASYVLEEDDDGAFSSPVIAYSGASTYWSTSNHAFGTYYYRVKARSSLGDSVWSNVQSTTVIPPQSNTYVENDTGCTLCFEVFDTGIGQKCFSSAGSQFYGSFPVGNYRWAASACCGSMNDSDYFGSTWSYRFYCISSVTAQADSSALLCTPLSNGLTQSNSTRLP
jgi:hypothetical protein